MKIPYCSCKLTPWSGSTKDNRPPPFPSEEEEVACDGPDEGATRQNVSRSLADWSIVPEGGTHFVERRTVSRGLQLHSLWIIPTAAVSSAFFDQAEGGGGGVLGWMSGSTGGAERYEVSRGLQLQFTMENPYCSCKLTPVRQAES